MTHYHYYVDAGREVDDTTRFYLVSCGTSRQGNRDYLYLLAHAVEHGHYFAIRSLESSQFVMRMLSDGNEQASPRFLQGVTARCLVRAFKTKNALPLDQHALDNRHHMLNYLNLNYRISSRLSADEKR